MVELSDSLEETIRRLEKVTDTPQMDAQVLFAHFLNKPRTWVLAHPETPLTQPQLDSLEIAVSRFENGEPLPYILGHWEFFGMDFNVDAQVLIPRPETELLVEKAIAWLQESPVRRTVADVGTGSGVIAVSIAVNVPDAQLLATDISLAALEVARRNARKFNVSGKIDFLQCDILPTHHDPLPTVRHFDLISANLPYIPTGTLQRLPIFGREPTLALDGGADGLDPFRKLMKVAPEWLAPNSLILLEIEATRGLQALSLVSDMFSEAEIHLHQDLTGRDRLLEIRL